MGSLFFKQGLFQAANPLPSLFLFFAQRLFQAANPALPLFLFLTQCLLAVLGPLGAALDFSLQFLYLLPAFPLCRAQSGVLFSQCGLLQFGQSRDLRSDRAQTTRRHRGCGNAAPCPRR